MLSKHSTSIKALTAERDEARAEVARLKSEVDRLVADRLGAYAAELARLTAERDALLRVVEAERCARTMEADRIGEPAKDEAVARVRSAAGLGAAGEGTPS